MHPGISTAQTSGDSSTPAIAALQQATDDWDSEFILLLHGPHYVGEELETALESLPGPVYGCSTSGEISPVGYTENTLVALGFDSEVFTCVPRRIEGLQSFGFQQARELVPDMKSELSRRAPDADPGNTFALMLIDSNSFAEEFVAAALGSELGNVPLVGGSSGDNWQLGATPVLYEGRSFNDSAVLLLVHSKLPFRHYNFNNFVPTSQRGVITSATASERLVHEINGAPASTEFARMCGLRPEEIDREHLALHPAIITVGERAYPRGFAELLDDGSLRCACAIDEGVVFRVAAQIDYVDHLANSLEGIREDLGEPLLLLGLECAARRQMVEQQGLSSEVATLFKSFNVWGFSCMGEQANSLNMNNSFNCIAFALQQ
jgi:hypothetical protein